MLLRNEDQQVKMSWRLMSFFDLPRFLVGQIAEELSNV
jgi:hypothetical protein